MTSRRKGQARKTHRFAKQWEDAKRRAAMLSPGPERETVQAEARWLEAKVRNFLKRMARSEPTVSAAN